MRLRRRGADPTADTGASNAERHVAWDGVHGGAGPSVVIRAARASELSAHPETHAAA